MWFSYKSGICKSGSCKMSTFLLILTVCPLGCVSVTKSYEGTIIKLQSSEEPTTKAEETHYETSHLLYHHQMFLKLKVICLTPYERQDNLQENLVKDL